MNIVGKRYLYFAISLILIVPGLIGMARWGLPLSIDFTGGSYIELQFEANKVPELQEIRDLYSEFDIADVEPRTSGNDQLIINTSMIDNTTNGQIIDEMSARFNSPITVLRFDSVGPSIGKEVGFRAAMAIAMASAGILIYIWYAFRGAPNSHRYGIAAIIAMLHDIALIFGMQSILSHFYGWEIDALFLTAVLSVASFSVHDSIVVFDRIRENSQKKRRKPFETIVNDSINQTLARSINTQFTIFLTLIALIIFGGSTLRHFIVILLIGILSGTYSSIFNASPILVVWENREWNQWFKRSPAKG
ncbi:MAG: protein translocase subunit SecF [Chloroflexi bacterium]|jgi:preprotein translocase subunit SecF|nr:protein translocase subunit SecF [Chloroflexota bacterium]MBT3669776.1 protein translocase subunit SecF [Chloroflexota bacterium]MBT4002255.1 protein translocase subunit SecF [Chloroflexota bacterium]MBT4305256.1 protein translocase subunit SecF [Chloroflexota bacterium]MBT4534821.1 protein translocase subunit SecF [Chloroflexota bacterium]